MAVNQAASPATQSQGSPFSQGLYNLNPNSYITGLDYQGLNPNNYTDAYLKYMSAPPLYPGVGANPPASNMANQSGLAGLSTLASPTAQSGGTYKLLGNSSTETVVPPMTPSSPASPGGSVQDLLSRQNQGLGNTVDQAISAIYPNGPTSTKTAWDTNGNAPINPEQVAEGFAPQYTSAGGGPVGQNTPLGKFLSAGNTFVGPNEDFSKYGVSNGVAAMMNTSAPTAQGKAQFAEAAPIVGGVTYNTQGYNPDIFTYNTQGQAIGIQPSALRNISLADQGQLQQPTSGPGSSVPLGLAGTNLNAQGQLKGPTNEYGQLIPQNNPNIVNATPAASPANIKPMSVDSAPTAPQTGPNGETLGYGVSDNGTLITTPPSGGGNPTVYMDSTGAWRSTISDTAHNTIFNEQNMSADQLQQLSAQKQSAGGAGIAGLYAPSQGLYTDQQVSDIRNRLASYANDPYSRQQYLRTLTGGLPEDLANEVLRANGGTPGKQDVGTQYDWASANGQQGQIKETLSNVTQYDPQTGFNTMYPSIPTSASVNQAGGNFMDQYGPLIGAGVIGIGSGLMGLPGMLMSQATIGSTMDPRQRLIMGGGGALSGGLSSLASKLGSSIGSVSFMGT